MSEQIVDAVPAVKRPFYKRTEFWLTIVSLIFGALVAAGVFGAESIALKLLSMGLMVLASIGYTVGAAIAKVPLPAGTPGYKTSEFWICIVTSGLTAMQAIDVLPRSSEGGGVLALLAGVPGGAYAVARGKVKAAGATCLALVLMIGAGCSTWAATSRTALQTVYAGAKTSSTTGRQVIGEQCRKVALACQADRRAAELARDQAAADRARSCAPLVACHTKLHSFNTVIIDILLGVRDGQDLLELGEAVAGKQVAAVLEKVTKLLAHLRATIDEAQAR